MQHTGIYCILSLLTIAALFLGYTNLAKHKNPSDWLRIEAQLTDIIRLPAEHVYDSICYQGIYQGGQDAESYQFYSAPVADFGALKEMETFYVNPDNAEDYHPQYTCYEQGKGFLLLCVPALGFCAVHAADKRKAA